MTLTHVPDFSLHRFTCDIQQGFPNHVAALYSRKLWLRLTGRI